MPDQKPTTTIKLPFFAGKRWKNQTRMTLVYVLLTAGALFMIFPFIWMLSASLKPEWQVMTRPIIWIPQEWHQQEAGNTGRMFNLWKAKLDGETRNVIKIGTINYVAVVDLDTIEKVYSLPADQISEPSPMEVNGVQLNVRTTEIPADLQVIAIQRVGDNLVVVDIEDLGAFEYVSKSDFRKAPQVERLVTGVSVTGNLVPIEGVEHTVISIGGEVPYSTIIPAQLLEAGQLVLTSDLRSLGTQPVGDYEAKLFEYEVNGQPQRFINLGDEKCFSIVDYSAIEQTQIVPADALQGEVVKRPVGEVVLDLQTLPSSGEEVVLLAKSNEKALVGDPESFSGARFGCSDNLIDPRVETLFPGGQLRIMDEFDEQGANRHPIVILDNGHLMTTILPADSLLQAFEVRTDTLDRASSPKLNIGNYLKALTLEVGRATNLTFFKNSVILVILNILGQLISCTVVAYGFARLRAPGKNLLFVILLATMMLPFPVTMVPIYELFVRAGEFTREIGMFPIGQDTLWPLFIRSFFGNAFLIFLMRQFFLTIPTELEDAARIDGANRLQILRYLFLPLLKPALASVVIFTFMWTWNDFLEPLIYLDSARNYTVTLGLNFFQGQYSSNFHLLMAASVLALLPMMLLFFFAQRFFIEGITLTGMKG